MVSAYPRILMWPLLAAVFFAPAAATRCSDARAEMTAQCETGGVPIGDHDAYSGFTAFCGNTVCTSALRNVRFQCPSRCSADGTPLRDDEDQARVDAGVGLAFCGSCIKWKSQVTAKCDADLALSGAPAVAAYCENAECGFALQQMFAFCAPSNTDRENINEESRVICDGVSDCTIALTPSAPEHYAAAEGALMHCAPKTAPPAQLLRENRFMMNQWMDDLGAILKGSVKANRKLAEVSNPLVVNCPPTPTDAAPCPEDGDDDCHCPEGCDNCGNIEMKNFFDMTRCSTDDDTEVRAERCTMCNANGIDEESCWEDTIKEDACATDGGTTVPSSGSAFSTERVFQVDDWSTFPGGQRPVNWDRYAVLKEDKIQRPTWGMTRESDEFKAVPVNLLARFITFYPVENSGGVTFGPGMLELVVQAPNNTGGWFEVNGSAISQILITHVTSRSPHALKINSGNVNLAGGVNYGPGAIDITSTGRIVVSDMENFGTVNFRNTQKGFLLAATNRAGGHMSMRHVAGAIYECVNQGEILIESATAILDKVTNEPGGTIRAVDVTATLSNAVNKAGGTITVESGTYTFAGNQLNNAGTIDVGGSGSPPAVSIQGGVNTGTVHIRSGTLSLTLDHNAGEIIVEAGVEGSIAVGEGSTGSVTGPGAASLTQTTFRSSNPLLFWEQTFTLPPWGRLEEAGCTFGDSWEELTKKAGTFETGGLGKMMVGDFEGRPRFQVWQCAKNHPCADRSTDAFYCFVFDEKYATFAPWGPHSDLQIID